LNSTLLTLLSIYIENFVDIYFLQAFKKILTPDDS